LQQTTDFRVFPLLAETILWAIFTVLIVTSTCILLSNGGLHTRAKQVMLTLTLVMYVLSTLDWAIDVRRLWTDLKRSLPAELSSPPLDETRLNEVNTALHIIQSITNNICTLLSDLIVCWRVCVFYNNDKRVRGTAIFLIVALAAGIITCNLTQIGQGFPRIVHLHILVSRQLEIDVVTLILSALVNIWATGMIAWRAWKSRREFQRYLENQTTAGFAESVLTFFVETGTIYTVLWILKNVIIIPEVENTSYTDYAAVVMYQMTGMYPTLLIVFVALQKSHLEHQFTYPGTGEQGTVTPFSARVPGDFSSDDGMDTLGSSTRHTKAVGAVYPSGSLSDLEKQSGSEIQVKDVVYTGS